MGSDVVELKLDLINNILILPNFVPLTDIDRVPLVKKHLINIHQKLNYVEALYDNLLEK